MAITQLTKTEFSEKIANLDSAISEWHYLGSRPAIVDFYATWCGPCRTLAPILEELSEEYAGEVDIYKVDIDCEQELAAAFGVRSVPTLLFIPARGMPQMATGALPEDGCAKPSASCCSNSPPPSPDPAEKRQRRGVTDVTPLHVCRRIPPLRTYI